jgi:GT2 family glycosyltransferase
VREPGVGIAGCRLLSPHGTIQHAGVVFPRDKNPHHIYTGFPERHPAVNRSREFQAVTAACALVRRETFESLNRFDEAFLNGYEDMDLCMRLRRDGCSVEYCHEAVLYHLETATRDHSLDRRNFDLFLERWDDVVVSDDLDYYVEDGLLQLTYWEQYPILMSLSPLLGVLGDRRRNAAERALAQRSRELYEARKENAELRAELALLASSGYVSSPPHSHPSRPGDVAR